MKAVIDTNVLLVANGQHADVSAACVITCVQRLQAMQQSGVTVIDDGFRILGEYRHKTQLNLPKSVGDVFLKWLLRHAGNPGQGAPRDDKVLSPEEAKAVLLRRAATLSQALPSQAAQDYQIAVAAELAQLPAGFSGTEVERLVRQRLGQARFRNAMLDYWGGACSVTGVAVPAVLRASHAKPWADCASDEERLDVFNGFLLCAHLDALFDRFLLSFDELGHVLVSSTIPAADRTLLRLDRPLRLRWLTTAHHVYLQYHRERFAVSALTAQ